ncbi:MAG: uroporphyrinogen-III synthase [Cyanobacteria bacterium J06638_20]
MTTPPLTDLTVLVTRSAGQSSAFTRLLQAQGASVVEMPALEITPPSSWAALDDAIARRSDFHWLILTSTNGVDYFFQRLAAHSLEQGAIAHLKIAVVGKKTAHQLQAKGIQADFIPPEFVADSLIEHFPDPLDGCQILFPRVETGGRDALVKAFSAAGANVTEVSAYQSGCCKILLPEVAQALRQQTIQVITFASSKTVRCFQRLVSTQADLSDAVLDTVCIASIGPQTSDACRAHLGRVDIEASEFTLEGLTTAIVQWATSLPTINS